MSSVHVLTGRHAFDKSADRLHSSDAVRKKASSIYRRAHEHGLVSGRGKSANVLFVTSLYIASRLRGEYRTLGQFSRASGIPKRDLARSYRSLIMRLDLRMPRQDLVRCVMKLARQVRISLSTRRVATRIVDEVKKKRSLISGRNPMSIAAAALYLACLLKREKKTQREIARAADVTEVTVRSNVASLQREGILSEWNRRLVDRGVGRLNRPSRSVGTRGRRKRFRPSRRE